ncbi:MAG: hypothetical protein AAB697_01575 [Patescibacteria group bacterium]
MSGGGGSSREGGGREFFFGSGGGGSGEEIEGGSLYPANSSPSHDGVNTDAEFVAKSRRHDLNFLRAGINAIVIGDIGVVIGFANMGLGYFEKFPYIVIGGLVTLGLATVVGWVGFAVAGADILYKKVIKPSLVESQQEAG